MFPESRESVKSLETKSTIKVFLFYAVNVINVVAVGIDVVGADAALSNLSAQATPKMFRHMILTQVLGQIHSGFEPVLANLTNKLSCR